MSACPEFGQGAFGVTLLCDRPYRHSGDHHDPATDARWHVLLRADDSDPAAHDALFPLVDGDGLANYLSNLADAVSEQQTDLDAVVCTLRAVREALDADPPADDTRSTAQHVTDDEARR